MNTPNDQSHGDEMRGDAPDALDPLLRRWHAQDHQRAAELRDATMARVAAAAQARAGSAGAHAPLRIRSWIARGLATAAVLAIAVTAAFLLPMSDRGAFAAGGVSMLPEGGRMDAIDARGSLIGPCALAHTDVQANIRGPFTRVSLVQRFRNPYPQAIEAVYTFPLSERSAVDRMRMTVRDASGERIVDGVVRERSLARAIYEAARAQGYVASLLEQERPNIFTQSVANIAPGATVDVEISYIETLSARDGVYEFAFPMTVAPRYIPGAPTTMPTLPPGLVAREGIVLLGPAQLEFTPEQLTALPAVAAAGALPGNAAGVLAAIGRAVAIQAPAPRDAATPEPASVAFTIRYSDGSSEPGTLRADGTGLAGDRWFFLVNDQRTGTGVAPDTGAVPDASRITPMPTRPETRAGHDISLRVDLDTGGVPVTDATAPLHGIDVQWSGDSRARIALRDQSTIPNRDFVLRWSLKGSQILEGVFAGVRPPLTAGTEASRSVDGFLTLVLNPPARVAAATIVPRELVFVVDTSGSMNGFPIEKSKELMRRALASMRPCDTFNIVTFAGATRILWPQLKSATPEHVAQAQAWLDNTRSGGGTEMMQAIEAALVQMPLGPQQAPPAGGISVPPNTPVRPPATGAEGRSDEAHPADSVSRAAPMRLAIFLTDGEIGNDQAILAAIARNAGTTRVFTFGIGNSVNRYLLEEMAHLGRGACDIVLLADSADAAIARLERRMTTPVLADISITAEGIQLSQTLPSTSMLPDLFDAQPLVIHARYSTPGSGTIIVRGRTGAGPFERRIPVTLPSVAGATGTANTRGAEDAVGSTDAGGIASALLPQLWARARVDDLLTPHLQEVESQTLPRAIRAQVVALGEEFQIMTPYTSFVAVERTRVVSNGRPMLVTVPIELPDGTRFDSYFGDRWSNAAVAYAIESACATQDRTRERLDPAAASTAGVAGVADAASVAGDFGVIDGTDKHMRREARTLTRDFDSNAPQLRKREALGRTPLAGAKPGSSAAAHELRSAGGAVVLTVAATPPASIVQPVPPPPPPPPVPPAQPAPSEQPAPASTTPLTPSALRDRSSAVDELKQSTAKPEAAASDASGLVARAADDGSVRYSVVAGDTLSGIAARAYGRASEWRRILEANAALLHGDEHALQAGMELTLPGPVARVTADRVAPLSAQALDRLARVLDPRLLAIALHARLTEAERKALPTLPAELQALIRDGQVAVTITADAAGVDALKQQGVQVDASTPLRGGEGVLLLARIAPEALVPVALGEQARRIEPQEQVPAEPLYPAQHARQRR